MLCGAVWCMSGPGVVSGVLCVSTEGLEAAEPAAVHAQGGRAAQDCRLRLCAQPAATGGALPLARGGA